MSVPDLHPRGLTPLGPILALVLAATLMASRPARAEDFGALSRDYVVFTRQQDPIAAGQRGDLAAMRLWPDDTPQALAARRSALVGFKARIDAIDPDSLSEADALSRAVMARQVEIGLEGLAFDEARAPFQNGEGFYTLPETQAAMTVLHGEAEAQAWLARLAAVPGYFGAETDNLRRGVRTGFTQPELVTRTAIDVLRRLASEPADRSALLAPFATLPSAVSPDRRAALRAEAIALVAGKVRPAQAALAAYLEHDYLPKARPALGAASLPDGARYYAFLARRATTTELTPVQIHALGQAEVVRIRKEMDAVIAETGFHGDLRAFTAALQADPRLLAPSAQAYAEKADEIAKRTDYLLPRYFGRLPRLTYGVRTKPAGLESISSGYLPGSPDTGVAGAVVYDPDAYVHGALYSLPAWLLHEGVPGHHLQIALAQENPALPEYRRNDDVTAFVEGWALYSERLGEEMGVYRDPYERFGRLSMEMWRACRLVMDTGLHTLGWSRDQAAQCLRDNTSMTPDAIYREVDRYIGWPGQALAYKIGELRIVALRRRAEQALGDRFDLRAFHDAVLAQGALPLDLLEAHIDAWIAAQARTQDQRGNR